MTTLKKGDSAPHFSGTDQDGNAHTLSDYKGKN
jgi:peroxiredoxin Q/BCP